MRKICEQIFSLYQIQRSGEETYFNKRRISEYMYPQFLETAFTNQLNEAMSQLFVYRYKISNQSEYICQ